MKFFLFLIALSGFTYFLLEFFSPKSPDPPPSSPSPSPSPSPPPLAETKVIPPAIKYKAAVKMQDNSAKMTAVDTLQATPLKFKKLKRDTVPPTVKIDWDNVDTLEQIGDAHLVKFISSAGKEVVHGDVLLPLNAKKIKGKVLLHKPKLWKEGIIPYTVMKTLPNYEQVIQAIEYLNKETNIKFVARKDEKDFVAIISGKKNCYAGVGRHGGQQFITLAENCTKGAVIHELVHTLGFFHEQSRHDRDEFLQIFWGNIEKKFWPQFKKIPTDTTLFIDSPFDLKSIMLYPPNAFALNTKIATMATLDGQLYQPEVDHLSYWDREDINALYPDPVP